jgi:hypothetical protein
MVWSNLHFLMGLAALGHDVFFLEDSDDYPHCCYDPVRDVFDCDPTYGIAFAGKTLARIGFGERWAYHDAHTQRWMGPCGDHMVDICRSSDLLLNLCNVNPLRDWTLNIPVRAYVDEDPAFTQIKHLTNADALQRALQHTKFFSFAHNFGSPGCLVPDDGLPWQPTRQPVVLEAISPTQGHREGKFTTVMLWDSYPAKEFQGIRYGLKSSSFPPYIDLPRRSRDTFELALGGGGAPRDILRENGWLIIDPRGPTVDTWTYQDYIRNSKAEFSVAKEGYVASHSGWFSERSVTYLATGRPVVVQETGFKDWLPTGAGVLAFRNPDEAVRATEEVNARYDFHCAAARQIAEEHFDARKVLGRLIEQAMN